ncbi:hypothetical protein EOE18_04670 [Novosphingobium umbonatum]|jgi:hypothetical protein|uniref:Uncharacterized protein n=1 Tax=Novosphingobium umbonatum TaxID=1908524 RepID=A0A3S2USW8_9SPHN|nr:hypothetical protein [Novosphingobium umbonatum]RVU06145.1 hypothetical protein EOE18_04670 [Novosphingobium umbonatum]
MIQPLTDQNDCDTALERLGLALDRLSAATQKVRMAQLKTAADTVKIEVQNERLREVVGEALEQIDTLIAKVESEKA